ncbi:translocation/assembly module TamB domain-containing protein [Extensimonas vulgaris]|uniref:translocation/assembly module TamB domain-containing protein n=1 Tax=Extensimonas vulgaris TaxID=1031594 RepID=UPI001FD1C3FB|nr:translocation/assembly module TamB domain-containing protein [Extensimonas vulgaris]
MGRSLLRLGAILLGLLLALLLVIAACGWWWAGRSSSLADTLALVARLLPVEQRLESRAVQGTLREGGHIGWLRWSNPKLAVEVQDLRFGQPLGWRWAALLQGQAELGKLQVAQVTLTPAGARSTDAGPPTPPTALALPVPLQLHVKLRVDRLRWAGTPALELQDVKLGYRYTGSGFSLGGWREAQHQFTLRELTLGRGQYRGQATLGAQAPFALAATLDGLVPIAPPSDAAQTPPRAPYAGTQAKAHASVQGQLATAAASLELKMLLALDTPTQAAIDSEEKKRPDDQGKRALAKPQAASAADAMQAELSATLQPWAAQSLPQAQARLRGVDLAALWPGAPTTLLDGTLHAGPLAQPVRNHDKAPPSSSPTTPAAPAPSAPSAAPPAAPVASGWAIAVQLANRLAGPWDTGRLPPTALQGRVEYDGQRWSAPAASVGLGAGTATLQAHYTPASGAWDGRLDLHGVSPGAVHSAFDVQALAGWLTARREEAGAVRFAADLHAQPAPVGKGTAAANGVQAAASNPASGSRAKPPKPSKAAPAPKATAKATPAAKLRIDALQTEGEWQQQADGSPSVQLRTLQLVALQARVQAQALRMAFGASPAAQGRVQLEVPGAVAAADGSLDARRGAGMLQLQAQDLRATQQWLARLAALGVPGLGFAQQGDMQGQAQLSARWQGGWQSAWDMLQRPASTAGASSAPRDKAPAPFTLQATLAVPQLNATGPGAAPWQLRGVRAEFAVSAAQATLALDGALQHGGLQFALQTRLDGGIQRAAQTGAGLPWQARVQTLRLQAEDAQRPGPWTLTLGAPLALDGHIPIGQASASAAAAWTVQATAGQAALSGPLPGTVQLRWEPLRWARGTGTGTGVADMRLQTQGSVLGLPLAWVDALEARSADTAPLLTRLGLGGDLAFDGQWSVDTTARDGLRARVGLQRARGDLRIRLEEGMNGAGGAGGKAASGGKVGNGGAGKSSAVTQAGVRAAEVALEAQGDAVHARLLWDSERAGHVNATADTRIAWVQGAPVWPADAPMAGTLQARLPDLGAWSLLAPPGWRVRGTVEADAQLAGSRAAPRWSGTLAADDVAVRSVLDGIDLQQGRLRATLRGDTLAITEWRIQGGRGSNARIPGLSGNRTPPPQDGGTLAGTGTLRWSSPADGDAGIAMQLQGEARALQVLVRADRQVSVSGPVQAQLQGGQIRLRGQLTIDRAAILLPEQGAPRLGDDVVVHSRAKDAATQKTAQPEARATVQAARAPDIAVSLNLGRDFALQGMGLTTRLRGTLDIRSSPEPGGAPRITGDIATEQGRYRAWGQTLDIETGHIHFNGPYDNPALDILALRPNLSVRAGVQISGTAQAPRVRLYSDPEMPEAEKLSWVVLGRAAAQGGTQTAMLQQAALILLGRGGASPGAQIASRLGLDELGLGGDSADSNGTALSLGKRLSDKMYVTYEYGLTNALGAIYIFLDLTRHLTLRGQTGEKSALDIIYTLRRD